MSTAFRTPVAALLGVGVVALASCTPTTSSTTRSAPPQSHAESAPSTGGAAVLTPVIGSVLAQPIPVPATDGKDHLAYELQLTNTLDDDVSLTSLTVLAGEKTLLSLSADKLAYWTRVIGNRAPTTTLGPGQTALVWLDVAVDRAADGSPAAIPAKLSHAIGITPAKPSPPLVSTMTETIAPVAVADRKPIEISPPLTGPNWLDGDSCCDMGGHRMAVNPINGGLHAAERFAIDYVQLDSKARLFSGDKARLDSYPYYGADIHAVADGPVVAVVDGLPDQVPGRHPSGLTLDQYGGNHIVQDIGGGNYAFYAHLKPRSIKVKAGDRLSTGQAIAALGNSGNSDAPHLHFHVMDAPDPLLSNGLPFIFKSFTRDARLASVQALEPLLDGQPAQLQPRLEPESEIGVSPLMLDLMTYSAG
jgi:hypothetical protein